LSNITARESWMLRVATFAGVFGAVLAALALVGSLARASFVATGRTRALHALRALVALPVALQVFAAMFGEPHVALQWSALVGAALTVWISAVLGAARVGSFASARVTFALLAIGQSIELSYAPAQALLPPASAGGVLMAWLGRTAEVATLTGSVSAALWSYRIAVRAVGAQRTRLFLPFPVALAAMMTALVVVLPTAASSVIGRTAFGARFDWFSTSEAGAIHRGALLLYLVAPTLLLSASALSMASAGYDNGTGSRRALGWLLVLFAGFGVLRLAGPMDPIRLVMVSLAMVLLERSAERERLL
jgi:hypothetical protein